MLRLLRSSREINISIARVSRALWLFEARVVRIELDQSGLKPEAASRGLQTTLVQLKSHDSGLKKLSQGQCLETGLKCTDVCTLQDCKLCIITMMKRLSDVPIMKYDNEF